MSQIADFTDDDLVALAEQKHYGRILQYYRLKAGWKAHELIQLYGEAIRGEDEEHAMHPSWIYRMEQKNMVPIDPRRRAILARILDIPLAYFGLNAAAGDVSETLKAIASPERVDSAEYRYALARYTWGMRDRSTFSSLADIQRRIANLHAHLPYTVGKEHKQLAALLCGYDLLTEFLAADQMEYDLAIEFARRALRLAEHEKLYDIWIYALKELSNTYRERAEITAGLQGREAAQADFQRALNYHRQAEALKNHVQPAYRAMIDISMGVTLSFCARDKDDIKQALQTVDDGGKLIESPLDETSLPISTLLDQEFYFADRAVVLLAHPSSSTHFAAKAQTELENARKVSSGSLIRKGRLAVLEARALFQQGKYEMATAYAEAAADELHGSRLNLARLEIVYRQLRASPYGKSLGVAHLGLTLLKVQRPELFAV